jgi:hypothetical protein
MSDQPAAEDGGEEQPEFPTKERSSWIGPNGEDLWARRLDDDGNVRVDVRGVDFGSEVLRGVFGANDADYEEILRWEQALREGTHRGLTAAQLKRAYDAVCYANYRGLVFNTEVTIVWSRLGLRADRSLTIEDCTRTFFARFRKWAEVRNFPAIYIAVMEYGPTNGLHTHAALRVPVDHCDEFRDWTRATLKSFQAAGVQWDSSTVDVDPRKKLSVVSQWIWVQYLLKGLDPEAVIWSGRGLNRNALPLHQVAAGSQVESGGTVYIDRLRVSESLGESARKKAGFKPLVNILSPSPADRWSDQEFQRGLQLGKHLT